MTPSPKLIVLVAIGLVFAALPSMIHVDLWVLLAGGWLALAGCAAWDFASLLRVRPAVHADLDSTIGVGDVLTARLELEHGAPRPLLGLVRAEVDAPLGVVDDVQARLPPGRSAHELELRAERRGRGSLRALWIRLDGPLGLLRRIDRVALDARVTVLPNLRRVRALALEYFGAVRAQAGLRAERAFGAGGEFEALQPYVHGMDLRGVDWKASARHQALAVRRYRLEKNQRLVVCLDVGRQMADPIERLERLDHAVHAGLLVAYAALRAGDLVGLHAYGAGPERWLPPASGIKHLDRLMEAAAALSTRDVETNHFLGLKDLTTRLKRRSLVVIFTEFTDATTAELLVENLVFIAQRHLVIFVALDDPVIEAPLLRPPSHAEDLAQAELAGELRDDRRRVLLTLRRAGVDVVQGPPTRATLDLVARYVRVKRRGLIG